MEPTGTITKDFPFLDRNTHAEIESIMKEAIDYSDFVNLMAERASDSDCPSLIVFFALFHASLLDNTRAVNMIEKAHSEALLAIPFFVDRPSRDYPIMVEAVENAISSIPNYAVTFYLLMKLYRASENGSREETRIQKLIDDLLQENKQLHNLSADYIGHTGYRLRVEGNPEGALEYFERALQIARETDDSWHQSVLLTLIAEVESQYRKDSNSYSLAKRYLGEALAISKSLGDQSGVARILQNMSVFAASRGELGEALECQLEALRILESLGAPLGAASFNLATYYTSIGDGQNGLDWAKIALEEYGIESAYAHLAMARSYIELDKFDDAQTHLDLAKECALKRGLDLTFGAWHNVSAKLERKLGDPESAMDSYTRALDINERANRFTRARGDLSSLAETELELFSPTKENRNDEYSGPWMERFENEIEECDLPGYRARLLLMKAELRMKQGRHAEGEELMDSALELSNSPVTRYLHQEVAETQENWIAEGILPIKTRSKKRGD